MRQNILPGPLNIQIYVLHTEQKTLSSTTTVLKIVQTVKIYTVETEYTN
jgi:hypothetical protein